MANNPPRALPLEVLSMIFEYLDKPDIQNIRLSNRDFLALGDPVFGRNFLAHVRFMLSTHSLQALLDLTSHVTFAKTVQSINFSSRQLFPLSPDTLRSDFDAPFFHATHFDHQGLKKRVRAHRTCLKEQNDVAGHHALLVKIWSNLVLTNFGQHNVRLGVFASDDEKEPFSKKAYGYDKAYGDLYSLDNYHWSQEPIPTLKTLIHAIPTGLWVPNFEFDVYTNDIVQSRGFQTRATWAGVELYTRMQTKNVHSDFRFQYRITDERDQVHHMRFALARQRFEYIAASKLYTWGTIFGNIVGNSRILDRMLKTVNIRELRLENCAASPGVLGRFLFYHRKTLVHLELSHFQLEYTDYYSTAVTLRFLRFLKDKLQLECLVMEDWKEYLGYSGVMAPPLQQRSFMFEGVVCWRNKEEVQYGLSHFISWYESTFSQTEEDPDGEPWFFGDDEDLSEWDDWTDDGDE
ncbi:hypothetical protein D6C91_08155 [Aureobasidium pullulans]|uniref:F-box domain-containing protein n=1 Tax=Aureobasidium pullulans TaxID=5580 RepID=A0A4S9SR69_AURPU|nr:hypothetical protein D6C91_08155 [Aureobasidium pullulans]